MHLSQLIGGGVDLPRGRRCAPRSRRDRRPTISRRPRSRRANRLADIIAGAAVRARRWICAQLLAAGRIDCPLRHPDPAHMHVTGTGLTHLGTAATRDAMHAQAQKAEALTDSMKMFRMGLEGGKPAPGQVGRAARMVLQGQRPRRRRAGRSR